MYLLMTDKERVNRFFTVSTEAAKATFMMFGKLEVGLFFLLDKDGDIIQTAVPLINKDAVAKTMKDLAIKTQPLALVFISEAWMVQRTVDAADADQLMKGKIAVSEQPDKTECLMIVQETFTSSKGKMIPIVRGVNGVTFGTEVSHFDKMEGRFTHLLTPMRHEN
jgi:hypothetical protein